MLVLSAVWLHGLRSGHRKAVFRALLMFRPPLFSVPDGSSGFPLVPGRRVGKSGSTEKKAGDKDDGAVFPDDEPEPDVPSNRATEAADEYGGMDKDNETMFPADKAEPEVRSYEATEVAYRDAGLVLAAMNHLPKPKKEIIVILSSEDEDDDAAY